MLNIRLARVGKKGHATFRVVVTEHTRPPKSGALAQLGWYDPHRNTLQVDAAKTKWYLAHGANTSPTVRNLLVEHQVIEGPKVVAWKPKKSAQKAPETGLLTTVPAGGPPPTTPTSA